MTAPTAIPPADLLAQLGELINATQTVSADAGKWRLLLSLLGHLGYGPRIEPETIAALLPNARRIADAVTASQEVPPPAAPKSANGTGRRKITEDDKQLIQHAYQDDGISIRGIMEKYGYSKSTVERYAHAVDGDAA